MTDNIVERVAIAIKNARALPGTNPVARLSNVDRRAARAAIAALREPTFGMKMAGATAITLEIMEAKANYDGAADCWHAMIDQLLSEISSEGTPNNVPG